MMLSCDAGLRQSCLCMADDGRKMRTQASAVACKELFRNGAADACNLYLGILVVQDVRLLVEEGERGKLLASI